MSLATTLSPTARAAQAQRPLPLAVTMGEPSGIGGEIALKAWLARAQGLPVFYLIDEPDRLAALAAQLGIVAPIARIDRPEQATRLFAGALPVFPQPLGTPVQPGRPDHANASAVLGSIRRAVEHCRGGQAGGVVTNPIHKRTLYETGFTHPGHTEFLAQLAGKNARAVMMLVSSELRVVPVTIHVSLRQAVERLTQAEIIAAGRITAAALRDDFGITAPRLAVTGLNPHAGEEGSLGRDEQEIVAPAVQQLCKLGINAFGPMPADTMFHPAARRTYDAILCMYHDQALIPIKTIDFWGAVNLTLGLPFVRTSPDHGTALDIAGTGKADAASLIAAIKLAGEIVQRRTAGAHAPASAT
ncbi:MAG: 4-hydroxythreonine-4-phosphate dehydrogenase PdxA [Alphaproteobacteria bacterium]|nr:4-hydroxythreonine-4-phosphate dehydrogenase PdxA [Alphaproteobacteria bacterium]